MQYKTRHTKDQSRGARLFAINERHGRFWPHWHFSPYIRHINSGISPFGHIIPHPRAKHPSIAAALLFGCNLKPDVLRFDSVST
ncbi:hypothetical protein BC2230_11134 [Burkholderia cepacia]